MASGSDEDAGIVDRGLLDLTVRLSVRELTAGKQFAIFVLVKNPFARSVWIERVHVSLPSELVLADQLEKGEARRLAQKAEEHAREQAIQARTLKQKIDRLQASLDKFETSSEDSQVTGANANREISRLRKLLEELSRHGPEIAISHIKSIGSLRIESATPRLELRGTNDGETDVGSINIVDPRLAALVNASQRQVKLRSSLPDGAALQPSSTAVYTVLLDVIQSFVFPPSSYTLQFSVNFSFEEPPTDRSNDSLHKYNKTLMTNTVSHDIMIRPSVYSLMGGAMIGGATGSVARLLKGAGKVDLQTINLAAGLSGGLTVLLAIILSAVAIIFVARKSEAQSFISVEDFWGGLLIGFFVGYTGTEFFGDLTRLEGGPNGLMNMQD